MQPLPRCGCEPATATATSTTYSALPSSTACFCRPEFGRAFETALREATPESPASFLSSRFFPRPHCARILLGSTPRSSCATVIDPATPASVRSNSISRTPLTTTCYDLLAPRTILQLCLTVSLLSRLLASEPVRCISPPSLGSPTPRRDLRPIPVHEPCILSAVPDTSAFDLSLSSCAHVAALLVAIHGNQQPHQRRLI